MLIGCAEWFFNAAELCKISVEVWMSAMGSHSAMQPCRLNVRITPETAVKPISMDG